MTKKVIILDQVKVQKVSMPKKVGYGHTYAHYGEFLQGVFPDPNDHLTRGLVTVPCSNYECYALFEPCANGIITVQPQYTVKAKKAAEITLRLLNRSKIGGRLSIKSNIPNKQGLGSSTADIVATIKAVSNALQLPLSGEVIAKLAVQAEGASDSIIFKDRAVLFAHREGRIIEDFCGRIPPITILGVNTDLSGVGVDTLAFTPAHYTSEEIETFRVLQGAMRRAVADQDPWLLGRIATVSAKINQKYLPKPQFGSFLELVEVVGALGLQVANSGTVVGLMFDPYDSQTPLKVAKAKKVLERMKFPETYQFITTEGLITF